MSSHSNDNASRNYQEKPLSPKEKIGFMLPAIIGIVLAVGIWIGIRLGESNRGFQFKAVQNDSKYKIPVQLGKVTEVLKYIDARYVKEVDLGKLQDEAIKFILQKLDPHSNYISVAETVQVNESLAGGFEGIGVEFHIFEDTVCVVGVIPDGPSDKAGLQAGDRIIYVGDSLIAGQRIDNNRVIAYLKGEAGKPVDLKLQRRGEEELIKLTVTRGQIPVKSVDIAYMLDEKTAYIKISRFSSQTFEEFAQAVFELKEEGMENIVLDLRDNPGGYLKEAKDILNEFFKGKTELVRTKGRNPSQAKNYEASRVKLLRILFGKVAILINEGSASASEIIAGAIQDNDRGIVLGRRSFGKGLVQEQYPLQDGSALRLTVAQYFTPSGRLIQKPYSGKIANYNEEMINRRTNGELYFRDSIKVVDSVEYKTSAGRIVYGGGGIIPDVFVPADSLDYNTGFVHMTYYAPQFIYKYMDKNFRTFQSYSTFEEFNQNFQVTEFLLEDFFAFLKSRKVKVDRALLTKGKEKLKTQLKARLAQQLFREEGLFKVLHQHDSMLKRALEEINAG